MGKGTGAAGLTEHGDDEFTRDRRRRRHLQIDAATGTTVGRGDGAVEGATSDVSEIEGRETRSGEKVVSPGDCISRDQRCDVVGRQHTDIIASAALSEVGDGGVAVTCGVGDGRTCRRAIDGTGHNDGGTGRYATGWDGNAGGIVGSRNRCCADVGQDRGGDGWNTSRAGGRRTADRSTDLRPR